MTPEQVELSLQHVQRELLDVRSDVNGLRYEVYGNGKVGLKQTVSGFGFWLWVLVVAMVMQMLLGLVGFGITIFLLITIL